MNKEEIIKLSKLSRIELSDDEIREFEKQYDEILSFIGQISEVEIQNQPVRNFNLLNVFRRDEISFDEKKRKLVLEQMPEHDSENRLKVKKIL